MKDVARQALRMYAYEARPLGGQFAFDQDRELFPRLLAPKSNYTKRSESGWEIRLGQPLNATARIIVLALFSLHINHLPPIQATEILVTEHGSVKLTC
jgi:hypothetical protein